MAEVQFLIIVCTCLVATCTYAAVTEGHCADGPDCQYCINGWYRPNCDVRCPSNCEGASGCHRLTGQCDHACALNNWGNFCEHPCPPNCRQGCNQMSSRCHGGCFPGRYGTFCNMSCADSCSICDQLTGMCIKAKVPSTTEAGSTMYVQADTPAVPSKVAGENYGQGVQVLYIIPPIVIPLAAILLCFAVKSKRKCKCMVKMSSSENGFGDVQT